MFNFLLFFPLSIAASFCKQPQDLVLPEVKLCVKTSNSVLFSHWHCTCHKLARFRFGP
uniref:Uncharacterized protein n=1 Tax=Bacteriophage sp. TaxID=38018 RepID=A0A8D9UHT8_9VIRU|nr:MAG TPA: hypothetical protein [Bacteriophage sp.]